MTKQELKNAIKASYEAQARALSVLPHYEIVEVLRKIRDEHRYDDYMQND